MSWGLGLNFNWRQSELSQNKHSLTVSILNSTISDLLSVWTSCNRAESGEDKVETQPIPHKHSQALPRDQDLVNVVWPGDPGVWTQYTGWDPVLTSAWALCCVCWPWSSGLSSPTAQPAASAMTRGEIQANVRSWRALCPEVYKKLRVRIGDWGGNSRTHVAVFTKLYEYFRLVQSMIFSWQYSLKLSKTDSQSVLKYQPNVIAFRRIIQFTIIAKNLWFYQQTTNWIQREGGRGIDFNAMKHTSWNVQGGCRR